MKKIAIILAGIFVFILAMGSMNMISAQSYIVESIEEEKSSRGYYPRSLYRDSKAYGCMCGSDVVFDYIFEFYVPNSYANRSRLRITGTNPAADCYIRDKVDARVYSNNMIRACVGYNWVFACGMFPYRNDIAIWIK